MDFNIYTYTGLTNIYMLSVVPCFFLAMRIVQMEGKGVNMNNVLAAFLISLIPGINTLIAIIILMAITIEMIIQITKTEFMTKRRF